MKYEYEISDLKEECYKLSILHANTMAGRLMTDTGLSVQQITITEDDDYFFDNALKNKKSDIEKMIYNMGLNVATTIPAKSSPYRTSRNPVVAETDTKVTFELKEKPTVTQERLDVVREDIFKYITTGICSEVILQKVNKDYSDRFTVEADSDLKALKQNLFYLI